MKAYRFVGRVKYLPSHTIHIFILGFDLGSTLYLFWIFSACVIANLIANVSSLFSFPIDLVLP